ncbi:MAG TPA: YhcH/YjgK/YiaL family protein [Sphingobacteriaceae bacterium]|nr:YhcH/YjgK/YiaL family protein [Sphingobacteriaceae bacterium]
MIIDALANIDKYRSVHPLFGQAFEHIKSLDLEKIEVSRYDIADGLKAIISDKTGMSVDESISKFECHNKNIDIQICIRGVEKMGWKPRSECRDQKGDYNEEKDVLFYNDTPDMFFQLTNGQFAVFFPEDVHAPMIGDGEIKKLVLKIRL